MERQSTNPKGVSLTLTKPTRITSLPPEEDPDWNHFLRIYQGLLNQRHILFGEGSLLTSQANPKTHPYFRCLEEDSNDWELLREGLVFSYHPIVDTFSQDFLDNISCWLEHVEYVFLFSTADTQDGKLNGKAILDFYSKPAIHLSLYYAPHQPYEPRLRAGAILRTTMQLRSLFHPPMDETDYIAAMRQYRDEGTADPEMLRMLERYERRHPNR